MSEQHRSGAQTTQVVVVVSGNYGRPLVEAAEVLVGPLELAVVEIPCMEDSQQLRGRVDRAVAAAAGGARRVLLLTDLCGSTPFNACVQLTRQRQGWETLTGINLPMLMKLATADRTQHPRQLALALQDTARRSFRLAEGPRSEEDQGGD